MAAARCTLQFALLLHLGGSDRYQPKLSDADRNGEFALNTPEGEELRFSGIIQVALWAEMKALKV